MLSALGQYKGNLINFNHCHFEPSGLEEPMIEIVSGDISRINIIGCTSFINTTNDYLIKLNNENQFVTLKDNFFTFGTNPPAYLCNRKNIECSGNEYQINLLKNNIDNLFINSTLNSTTMSDNLIKQGGESINTDKYYIFRDNSSYNTGINRLTSTNANLTLNTELHPETTGKSIKVTCTSPADLIICAMAQYKGQDVLKGKVKLLVPQNYNGKIVYSRMPDIFIDCDDKNAFVDNLIHELSPISLDEFVDYVYQNYGHKTNTFRALLMSYFSKYITNGQIISECPEFTQEQIEVLNGKLTEDIYSIITIKELLTDLFDVNDFKLINNLNMSKIGYRLRGNYIMKSSITNLEGYMRDIILNSDYYEIKPEMKKIGSTFSSYLYKFIYNLDLFEIDKEKYITIKKLNELGISKDNIREFINEIDKVISDNEYFNLYTLDKDNFLTNLKKYNFPDCFYETIISAIPDVKTFTVKNNVVFIKTDEQATREKFINSFVTKNKIFVSEIKKDILTKYNIDLYEYYIKEFIDKKKYYFDNSIDCVYISKDYYDEDINDLDILSLID